MRSALSLILVAVGSLSGCATPTPVRVPIAVACVLERPARPADCSPRDETRAEWLRCALVEREALRGYVAELEATIDACASRPESGIKPPPNAFRIGR